MGDVYLGSCPDCGYSGKFNLGSGLSSVNLERSIRVLDEKSRMQILEMKEKNRIESFEVENKLVYCIRCKMLQDKTIITIRKNDGQVLTFGNQCSACNNPLIVFQNAQNRQVLCPNCKKADLKFEPIGYWD